jgi:hypothetical protein
MPPDPVSYQESTGWPGWASLLAIASLAAAELGVWLDGSLTRTTAVVITAVFALGVAAGWLLFGRLRVQVTRSDLLVGFGFVRLIQKRIPYSDIAALETVSYRPLLEFGGWGIRYGRGGKRAWTMRGNRAVRLQLRDGVQLYVGSETPERLAERIRAAGGGRWSVEDEAP